VEAAKSAAGGSEATAEQIQAAAKQLIADAVKPILSNTEWRTRLLAIKRSYEQINRYGKPGTPSSKPASRPTPRRKRSRL